MKNEHMTPEEIQSYLKGTLDDLEDERIIIHLGVCEDCLDEVDRSLESAGGIGSIENDRVKARLFQQIYRTNSIGHFIKLGVNGFWYTFLSLLFPFRVSKMDLYQKKESEHE